MQWWQVPTFSAEVAYEGQQFASESSWIKIRGTSDNVMWQKERLLNLLVERLPVEYQYICWIDADIIFLDPDWVAKTRSALDRYMIVQMWDEWHCIGGDGKVVETLTSIGDGARRFISRKAWSPGGALAGRRSVFPLYDRHIVGSGDALCMEGWLAMKYSQTMYKYTDSMRDDFMLWSADAFAKVQGNIGSMKYDIMHMFHGSRQDRQYIDRWSPVIDAGFDPTKHVCVDDQGLLKWTKDAPKQLQIWVKNYFASRLEDTTDRPYRIKMNQ